MRLNTMVTLGASAAFGIMAVVLARGWINGAVEDQFRQATPVVQTPAQTVQMATRPVVIADIGLVFGDEVSADILSVVDMPEDLVPELAFASVEDIFDPTNSQNLISLTEIHANEVILPHKVSGQGARASLSARITPGYRAAAIRVDDVTGVAGFVAPGDLVDILYTFEPNPDADIPNYRTDIILQSVKVLGVDQNFSNDNGNPDVARTVTVEVNHSDAQALAAAMEGGTLSLSLRAIGETDVSTTKPAMSANLTPADKKPRRALRRVASKPKPKTDTNPHTDVVVIRGDAESKVTVLSEDKQKELSQLNASELAGG